MHKLMIISLNSDPILQYGTEHNGGQSKYILELGKNLIKEGWELDVFTIRNPGCKDIAIITEGFTVYRFPLPDNQPYSYAITKSDIEFVSNSISEYIANKSLKYDIILCCYWLGGMIGLKLKQQIGKNVLVTFCSLGYFKQQTPGINFRIKQEALIAQKIDHIIATSEEEKKILINYYNAPSSKISVIPRGVDTHKFKKIYDL